MPEFLQFMQRAANAEVKAGQKDKEDAQVFKAEADDGNFVSSAAITKRWYEIESRVFGEVSCC